MFKFVVPAKAGTQDMRRAVALGPRFRGGNCRVFPSEPIMPKGSMALSDAAIRRAEAVMQARMAAGPCAISARYDRRHSRVVVSLDNGLELAFPPDLAEGLDNASVTALAAIEISPTGLGLHWPKLDADLYLPALLNGVFGSPRWMAGLMGRKGGRARTAAKIAAARANGRRGGRPRKKATGR